MQKPKRLQPICRRGAYE